MKALFHSVQSQGVDIVHVGSLKTLCNSESVQMEPNEPIPLETEQSLH